MKRFLAAKLTTGDMYGFPIHMGSASLNRPAMKFVGVDFSIDVLPVMKSFPSGSSVKSTVHHHRPQTQDRVLLLAKLIASYQNGVSGAIVRRLVAKGTKLEQGLLGDHSNHMGGRVGHCTRQPSALVLLVSLQNIDPVLLAPVKCTTRLQSVDVALSYDSPYVL